jgi:RNA polymerase sigma factor (TIGR02999 family)
MSEPQDPASLTALLSQWRRGDRSIEPQLMQQVYPVLRQIAQSRLNRAGAVLTFSATELANETYARLVQAESLPWADRRHFYAVAALATRNFVVDHLRARDTFKRGGDLPLVSLSELDDSSEPADAIDLRYDWLGLHAALTELEALNPVCARVVELKFFSGLTSDEIADACDVSRATVVRHWRFARAWLLERLGGGA